MPFHILTQLYGILRSVLFVFFILSIVSAVDGPPRIRFDDLRLRMIENFTKAKFNAINQSDIDMLKSMMSKTVKTGRAFHYMWKLHGVMQIETQRLDFAEDYSSKDWVIKAFRPATYDMDTATFTDCTLCSKTREESSCNVTRIELLVPLLQKGIENETANHVTFVEINGFIVNSSRGTVNISGAVIFDLTNILHKVDSDKSGAILKVKIRRPPCPYVFPNRSMLYEYCNINSTILDRFWIHNQRETVKLELHKNHHEGTELETVKSELQSSHHEELEFQNRKTENIMEGSEESESGDEPEMPEVVGELTWTVSDRVQGSDSKNNTTNTDPLISSAISSSTQPNVENYTEGQNLRPTTYHRQARSSGNETTTVLQLLKTEEFTQQQGQQQHVKNTRRPYKEKRHLGQVKGQHDEECLIKPDRLTGECKRHSFHMSFQLHMNRWDILVPDYLIDIGYCSSSCRHANHFSTGMDYLTAHAVIVNSIRGKTPMISCSPRKMSTISIIKLNHIDMSLVVENLWNAKVESCWCT